MGSKNVDVSSLETVNVGIVGHIDHGKTTLLQRLSGKWADTHSEELKRGITIKLGYADAVIREDGDSFSVSPDASGKPLRYVTFVDAPGHEMLMATTLSGAAIMDAAVLVVAANEGIKPQTKEHLVALKAKHISNIIVVQNKIDLVSRDQALKNYDDIKSFIKGTVADGAPIIPVSAQQGVNIDLVLSELLKVTVSSPSSGDHPVFLVARSFDINKPGTPLERLHGGVLGGALKVGSLKVGDTVEIKPGYSMKKGDGYVYHTVKTKIVSMQKGEFPVSVAVPGGSLALETDLDPSLTRADALSGSVASFPGVLPDISSEISVSFELFEEIFGSEGHVKPDNVKVGELLMLSINTSITVGQVLKVSPKDFSVSLKIPVVPLKGESVGIARNIKGHWRLIGFGSIA